MLKNLKNLHIINVINTDKAVPNRVGVMWFRSFGQRKGKGDLL